MELMSVSAIAPSDILSVTVKRIVIDNEISFFARLIYNNNGKTDAAYTFKSLDVIETMAYVSDLLQGNLLGV